MDYLIVNAWLAIGLWILLYISDYVLTIATARLYAGGADQHVRYEKGLELTPIHQRDVSRLRWISPRFILILVLTSGALWLLWGSLVGTGYDRQMFAFVLGAWLLLEAAVHMRHLRNLFTFCYLKHSQGVEGQIRYKMWLSYRMSAVDMLGFAGLYLFLFFLFDEQFILGGAVACCVTAVYHWILGARARRIAARETADGDAGLDAQDD
jgi:hypothetical protein